MLRGSLCRYTDIHTYIYIYIHIKVNICIRPYIHARPHMYIYSTNRHTVYVHKHVCTYVCIYKY